MKINKKGVSSLGRIYVNNRWKKEGKVIYSDDYFME